MAITTNENDIKERLSFAYVAAIAGHAGCQVVDWAIDKESVDITARAVSGSRACVDLQVKSTSSNVVDGAEVFFDLPIKNYNELRMPAETHPHYLVLLHLPGSRPDWVDVTIERLMINGCAYWEDLIGKPEVSNESTKRVRFSIEQRFTPEILGQMINLAPARITR